MITSRLTLRSFPTRSSSLDLASGRITYRSKSKLTVDAVVTFSAFGTAFGGAGGGGGGGGCGGGAGGGAGGGSGGGGKAAEATRADPVEGGGRPFFQLLFRGVGVLTPAWRLGRAHY